MKLAEPARQYARRLVAQPGRWGRLLVAAAFALVAVMYCTNTNTVGDADAPRGDGTYRPVLARGDGHMLYLVARSTALDLDWSFDNDLARFGDPWPEPPTPAGRRGIVQPLGPALVWTPLIWLAQGGAVIANVVGADIQLHGYTLWHQRFVFFSSVVFACGAVLLGRRIARSLVGGAWAPSYGAVAALLGTPLLYYATYMPSYAHAMDAFACSAFLAYWVLTIGRRDRRRWLALGLLLGLAALIRVQEAAMGIVVAFECVRGAARAARAKDARDAVRWLASGAAVLGIAAIVFVPQLLEWRVVYGSAAALPQGSRYVRPEAPMIGELLFSPRNGWLSSHPIAYLGVIGLFLVPARARFAAAGLVATIALQIYLNSTIIDWWSGSSFGQRRLCSVTLPLVVGLAALIWRAGRLAARLRCPRTFAHAVLVLGLGPFIAWNYDRVRGLAGGNAAPSEPRPTCCGGVPWVLRGPARWFYEKIGNPFELPASAVFALRHGVSLARWDQIGQYPLIPPWNALEDKQLSRHHGWWRIPDAELEPYLLRGFSRPLRSTDRPFRWTTERSAVVLVPNLMPYGQRLTLWMAPAGARRVTLRFEGEVVASAELTGWTGVSFELPHPPLHTNELEIESEPAVMPRSAAWPEPPGPVGVAVGPLAVTFLAR